MALKLALLYMLCYPIDLLWFDIISRRNVRFRSNGRLFLCMWLSIFSFCHCEVMKSYLVNLSFGYVDFLL